ncbi:hypothetical protein [Kitasatospora purpeofusca]|uniref:hypothetical protein n=1 Tax=Kitasatospora purpeofusca TaxID=67352 RepID=UPI0036971856
MHHRTTTIALAGALLALTVTACSSSSGHTGPGAAAAEPAPLTTQQLQQRLLTTTELGSDYVQSTSSTVRTGDVGMQGCPALEKLAGTSGGKPLAFTAKATAGFAYTGPDGVSVLSEELHSDTAAKLSSGVKALFDAYASCPSFQMTAGSSPVQITIAKMTPAPLGDEQYRQTMTIATSTSTTVIEQAAVRVGTVEVMLTGAPGLVEKQLPQAVQKARTAA